MSAGRLDDRDARPGSLKQISIAVLATLSLASSGCKQAGGAGEAIAKLTELRDKMCACADKACTEAVSQEMTRWGQEVAKAGGDKQAQRSAQDAQQLEAVTDSLIQCETKILTGAAPR